MKSRIFLSQSVADSAIPI
jgi:hypothetical protein